MAVQCDINGYEVKVTYAGDQPSPLDPKDFNANLVNVKNTKTGCNTMILIWRPEIPDGDTYSALYTFYCVLQAGMFGALNPAQFCATMGVDPEEHDTEVMFAFFREVTARLAPIVNDRKELTETMRMIEQKIGVNKGRWKKPKRINGSSHAS